MRILVILLSMIVACAHANDKERTYQGSTPADRLVRNFLGISFTDSIDFIRWELLINQDYYALDCVYGLANPGTNGHRDEKTITQTGMVERQDYYLCLQSGDKILYLLEVNASLLHLLDNNKDLLTGNDGYSYALNSTVPVKTDAFNYSSKRGKSERMMAYQGRTPCQELSVLLGRNSSAACNKLKWYIILFSDPLTGQPLYYLEGGRQYRKASMSKGKWEIIQTKGRVIYKLQIDRRTHPMYLLKAGDNILFFVDAEGKLLVGNEDFSYTLNRTRDREP